MRNLRTFLVLSLALVTLALHASSEKLVKHTEATLAPEVMAEFPGGDRALFSFVEANLDEPAQAKAGRVIVRVIITEDGKVRSARVMKSIGCPVCDQEALRVVYAMPDWEPAKTEGENVASYYTIPVNFTGS